MTFSHPPRQLLLQLLSVGLKQVNGRDSVYRSLISGDITQPLHLIAVGKCAAAMASGAFAACDRWIQSALVITKQEEDAALHHDRRVTYLTSAHPVPDQRSLDAGRALLEFINKTPENSRLLFLISGGTSSLVEWLPDGVTLAELVKVNSWLLANDFDIHEINAIRKRLSLIKGGGMLRYIGRRSVRVLLISDVPHDALGSIGSGWFFPESPVAVPARLPTWLSALLEKADAQRTQLSLLRDAQINASIIASNGDACRAMAQFAASTGLTVHWQLEAVIQGEVNTVASRIARTLLEGEPGIYIWGGETTVSLPPLPGCGGRNQQLALLLAKAIAGREELFFLSAGSDGNDGPTEDAGGLVDGRTLERGRIEGLDIDDYLKRADAGHYLAATGDLVHTGPTGTNVMDLLVAVKAHKTTLIF